MIQWMVIQWLAYIPSTVPPLCPRAGFSANPGLKFNPICFCVSVYFKILEKKTLVDPDKISEDIFLNSLTSYWLVSNRFQGLFKRS